MLAKLVFSYFYLKERSEKGQRSSTPGKSVTVKASRISIPLSRFRYALPFRKDGTRQNITCDTNIITLFNFDKDLSKAFYKTERNVIFHKLIKHDIRMDISFNNIIYLCNYLFVKSGMIYQLTPPALMRQFEDIFGQTDS